MLITKTNKIMSKLSFSGVAVEKFNELLAKSEGFEKVKNQHQAKLTNTQTDFFLEILRVYEKNMTSAKKTVSVDICHYCISQIIKGQSIDIEVFMSSVRVEKNEQKQALKIAQIQETIESINEKINSKSLQITVGFLNKPYKLGGLGFYKETALKTWLSMKNEIGVFQKQNFEGKYAQFEKARENNQVALKKIIDSKLK